MDNFLRYFFQDIGRVFRAFFDIFGSFFNFLNYLLNFPMRMDIIKQYEADFDTMDWILLLIVNLALVAIIVVMIWGLYKLCRKLLRFRVSP